MLYSVLPTRRNGALLTQEEIDAMPPVTGSLTFTHWRRKTGPDRSIRVALLQRAAKGELPQLLPPLFEPVVLRRNEEGFLLSGFQVEARPDGSETEQPQAWWVQQLSLGDCPQMEFARVPCDPRASS